MRIFFIAFIFLSSTVFAFEELNHKNFHEKIKNGNVIINFYASWCSICEKASENLVKYKKSSRQDIKIYQVDIAEEIILTKKYDAVSVPLLAYFKEGKIISKENGIKTVQQIKDSVEKNFF